MQLNNDKRNHKQSFKHEKYRNQKELSKHVWALKDKKIAYDIKWQILQQARPYSNGSKKCNLCTTEKFYIMCKPEMASMNTRAELVNTCKQRRRALLFTVAPLPGTARIKKH